MLKDIINKNFKKGKKEDKIKFPIIDGFVDVKGYDKDGKLFYHDYGDNVVTDWMRHAIMLMLCGVSFSDSGSMPDFDGHNETTNPDGYIFNNRPFLSDAPSEREKYVMSTKPDGNYVNALFPTKVLLGTGKEYSDWATLKSENETENQAWFKNLVKEFGKGSGEALASQNFDSKINDDKNYLSGTITNGVQSGEGTLVKCRTVNDPDTSTSNLSTSTAMYKNYNVVGAIKTLYKGDEDNNMLQGAISESGRLLEAEYRGVGNPCFIYFNQSAPHTSDEGKTEKWNQESNDIKLEFDKSNRYITKITFTINLPSQSGGDADKYYPYNGFQLKQIGLYNDGVLQIEPGQTDYNNVNYYPANNMQKGMLLAVKNIAPITKNAEGSYKITWTLSI